VLRRCARVALADVLASPLLDRRLRGHHLSTAAGLVIVLAVIVVEGLRAAAGALGIGDESPGAARLLVLVAVVGFGLLGLLDDLLGDGDARGFRGHLAALGQGRVTTGLCKLAGGAALALALAAAAPGGSGAQTFVDAALIALAANLASPRPGRTTVADALLRAGRLHLRYRRDRCGDQPDLCRMTSRAPHAGDTSERARRSSVSPSSSKPPATRHRRDRPVRRQRRVRVRVVQWCHRGRRCVRRPRSGRFGVKRSQRPCSLVGAGVFAAPASARPIRRRSAALVFSMPGVWSEIDTVDLRTSKGFSPDRHWQAWPRRAVCRPGAADAT
jgi:hypothetical protein